MPLNPDRARVIFSERNVRPPAGLRPRRAYNVTLCHERGSQHRGVLIVTAVVQLQFRNGTSQLPRTRGQCLRWNDAQKQAFARQFRSACYEVWNDKHRITTTSTAPVVRDIGVMFEIRTLIDGWHVSEHWEVEVERADDWVGSSVNIFWGNAHLDSQDVVEAQKPHGRQRGSVHEFGHMLGLRDEYRGANNPTPHWYADHGSVMNNGEVVRDRHYAMFAAWLDEQFQTVARLARETIHFRVNGSVDLSNAGL
jgi:hypothetical protein